MYCGRRFTIHGHVLTWFVEEDEVKLIGPDGGLVTSCSASMFANPEATHRSYELMAQRVMPHFQNNTFARMQDAVSRAQAERDHLNAEQAAALASWTEKHAAEVAKG